MRVDENHIPRLVQDWNYGSAETLEIRLFNGRTILVDKWDVRQESIKNYPRWNRAADQEAIDYFVEKHWDWFK
jgi:hypothetical protein